MSDWREWARGKLAAVRRANRWRSTSVFDGAGVVGMVDGCPVVSFASNDYLGLSAHPQVRAAAIDAIEKWGTGSTASRLVTGTRPVHHELEAALADWQGSARAVLFPTGYAANLGVLQVFAGPDTTIFCDELNHASLIDGCRASRGETVMFRHNDLQNLEALLAASVSKKIVVTEAVFSMDGDSPDLRGLAELCIQYRALLILDEAHAVLGPMLPADLVELECLRVGTLSKTFAALGGWVAGASEFIDLLVNRARTYIFTTAPTPADMAAALAALKIFTSEEGERLRTQLRRNVQRIKPEHTAPIIPIILGDEEEALAASRGLMAAGLYVPAIRPPTVPLGTARLRLALSALHTDEMIDKLRTSLARVTPEFVHA
ncbi:MAG TPA: 8-amino-7-oxononanoate synthase [Steroidobacteraceae bacterium]|nr:8-amino-7-oxononanoate synthase [Steroidobacteraceae bacterium]